MSESAVAGECSIQPSQVRVGVHVRIPLPWMQHSFMSSDFVVSSDAQVRDLLALGIDLYCDPRKCRVPPAPVIAEPVVDPAQEAELLRLRQEQEARVAAKQRREAAMTAMRERLNAVQKSFSHAADQTGAAMRQLGSAPQASVRSLLGVAVDSAQALLADPDSTILMVADKGTHQGEVAHALSVMTLALLLARRLGGGETMLQMVGAGALLHDAGTLTLSPSIVRNPARNRHEDAIYQSHCVQGARDLKAIGAVVPPTVLEIVLRHHERADGRGYPAGLRAEALSREVTIVSLADRFDELTNPVDPGQALSPFEALAVLWTRERTGFDEVLLQHFIRAMGIFPPGTLVQLSDGRAGVVVAAAPESARLCPQVLVYDPGTPRREAIIVDLAVAAADAGLPPLKIDKALRMQDRGDDELDYLLPRRKVAWFRGRG